MIFHLFLTIRLFSRIYEKMKIILMMSITYDKMLSDADLYAYKIFNLYVMPMLGSSDLFNFVTKTTRCIVFQYNYVNDDFIRKGVYSFKRLKNKYKKIGQLDVYINCSEQLQFSSNANNKKIYICIFSHINNEIIPNIYQFDKSFKTHFNPNFLIGESDYLTVYNEEFSNETIKNMVIWDELLSLVLDKKQDNCIFILSINNNKNTRQHFNRTLPECIVSLHKALVPVDMITLIEDEHDDLIIVNVQNDLYDYFLLLRLDKIKNEYIFRLISSPNDYSLTEKSILVNQPNYTPENNIALL